KPLP
ncbi:photosystem I P700 chlorophyll a apoprotein A2, partial [Gloeomargarita lithophora Alchichica-D10]